MTFEEVLEKAEGITRDYVFYSPSQIIRGDDKLNDPTKGERAWAVPRSTGEWLHDLVEISKPMRILELGTSLGYSTLWLAHAAHRYGGQVDTIELVERKVSIARELAADAELDNITFHTGTIFTTLTNLTGLYDLVFMDADRGNYLAYLPRILELLSPVGILIADNALMQKESMRAFIDHMKSRSDFKTDILDQDNGILFARRITDPAVNHNN